jgi:hypothetical protein
MIIILTGNQTLINPGAIHSRLIARWCGVVEGDPGNVPVILT